MKLFWAIASHYVVGSIHHRNHKNWPAHFLSSNRTSSSKQKQKNMDNKISQNSSRSRIPKVLLPRNFSQWVKNSNNATSFSRQSTVQTPVPSIEEYYRKMTGSLPVLRSSSGRMQFDYCHQSQHEDPIWLVETEEEQCSPCEMNKCQCNDMLMLQNHIDELNNERWGKDCLLQSMRTKVEDLRIELADKDRELQEKRKEIAKMKSDMEASGRDDLLKLRSEKACNNINDELNELRLEVAVLRYLLKVTDQRHEQELEEITSSLVFQEFPSHINTKAEDEETTIVDEADDDEDKDVGDEIELRKREYLAALEIAQQKPGEESLATAAELRTQLISMLGICSF